jgi:hypothetical protein
MELTVRSFLKAHFRSMWLADTNFPSENNFEVENFQLLTMIFSENFLSVEILLEWKWALKVENFQLQNFFQTENLCRPITINKIFVLRKIFLSGNEPLLNNSEGLYVLIIWVLGICSVDVCYCDICMTGKIKHVKVNEWKSISHTSEFHIVNSLARKIIHLNLVIYLVLQ